MLYCADCGKKLYQIRGRTLPQKEYFVCSTYRKVKGGCSSHQVRNEVIEELLLADIRYNCIGEITAPKQRKSA